MTRAGRLAGLTISVCLATAPAVPAAQCETTACLAAEVDALRQEVRALREQIDALKSAVPPAAPASHAEQQQLVDAKLDTLEQTKVESGSHHHVRLSGVALLDVAGTRGAVDNLDLPGTAVAGAPGGGDHAISFGVRQSYLNLEVFGPTLGGARTSAGVAFDFFGGFPSSDEGLTSPLMRLRTATFRMEWTATTVVAGQDAPFFSPRSPTSLATTAYPSLSSAGNMWTWTPQVRVERSIATGHASSVSLQAGVLDPLSGEPPASEYSRLPTAGERSGVPAQAVRVGWQSSASDRHAAFGAGAYHARQRYPAGADVDAWAVSSDWDVPLGRSLAISGELYRGQAIAGLGAGASASVVGLQPVETVGGWSQLKFKPDARLEFNAAYGADSPYRGRLRPFLGAGVEPSLVNRNASAFVNAIYQARSNLLFSIEYRRLWTTGLDDVAHTADHLSVTTGVGF